MNKETHNILKTTFGYDSFRLRQEEVVDNTVNGKDSIVIMPTGAGKSLCYQVPALALPGVALVVSPLIALMRDQVEALLQLGIKAAFLNSSQTSEESYKVKQDLLAGDLKLLYVAPERLVMPEFLELISSVQVNLIAIDEAHCVSQWGHDFRPEYLQLSFLKESFPQVPRLALTATADNATREDIRNRLELGEAELYLSGFDRPNINYEVILKKNAKKQILDFLKNEPNDHAGIIYCLSRKKTEDMAGTLRAEGYKAIAYHAGLSQKERSRNQDRFLLEEGIIVVATVAFGMGIDKPDVRFVIHTDLPKSMEAYYQETGRAGRDSLPAKAWMIYGLGDLVTHKQMIESGESSTEQKMIEHRKLNSLLGYCETIECRRKVLLNYFGDDLPKPCNNCDTCLTPPLQWNGTKEAQMALSTVYRTGQRFGVNYLVDVLLGNEDERIKRFAHDQLKVFGIGTEKNRVEWFSIFRQLIAGGYLHVDISGYGGLQLAPSSKEILKENKEISFRTDPQLKKIKTSSKSKARKTIELETEEQETIWQELRKVRTTIAKAQGVPPYVIFHDKTLLEMAIQKPQNEAEMLQITGVGESKLKKYGESFLEAVNTKDLAL